MNDPLVVIEDDVGSVLETLQRAILIHPVAAQALFYALVAEGRRFATTAVGREWQERLQDAELVVRARVLWDALSVRALEDNPDTVVPTAVLEAIVKAASDASMETFLENLFIRSVFAGGGSE